MGQSPIQPINESDSTLCSNICRHSKITPNLAKRVVKVGKIDHNIVLVQGSALAIPRCESIGSETVRDALAEGAPGVFISDINDEPGEAFSKSLNEQYSTGWTISVHKHLIVENHSYRGVTMNQGRIEYLRQHPCGSWLFRTRSAERLDQPVRGHHTRNQFVAEHEGRRSID